MTTYTFFYLKLCRDILVCSCRLPPLTPLLFLLTVFSELNALQNGWQGILDLKEWLICLNIKSIAINSDCRPTLYISENKLRSAVVTQSKIKMDVILVSF